MVGAKFIARTVNGGRIYEKGNLFCRESMPEPYFDVWTKSEPRNVRSSPCPYLLIFTIRKYFTIRQYFSDLIQLEIIAVSQHV